MKIKFGYKLCIKLEQFLDKLQIARLGGKYN